MADPVKQHISLHLFGVCDKKNKKIIIIFLNVSKTKELILDYRKQRAEYAPIHIDRAVV
jgi:hypothetical protein